VTSRRRTPPGYLAWLWVAAGLAEITDLPLHGVVQLAPIAADVGIAVAVHAYLEWRGAGERPRLAGAGLVMLGPVFVAISGYHGQFDAVAVLPAVLAVIVWERGLARSRALRTGLLLGVGTVIKTVPALLAVALVPLGSGRREAVQLVATTVAVPLIVVSPFLIAGCGSGSAQLPGTGGVARWPQPDRGPRSGDRPPRRG
jgi:uncharacterized membrane protein